MIRKEVQKDVEINLMLPPGFQIVIPAEELVQSMERHSFLKEF
jgi:hypothetical protein